MYFSWTEAIQTINQTAGMYPTQAVRLAAEVRPSADYLLNNILPNRNMGEYAVDSTSMTIRTTMAMLMAMDTAPDEGGLVEMAGFNEKTAKIGLAISLKEQQLRDLQAMIAQMRLNGAGGDVSNMMVMEALNFFRKICIQANFDTEEWMKGQAIFTGLINWTYKGKKLSVDYKIPTDHFLTQVTGNDGYGGTTSKFWADMMLHRRMQKDGIAAILLHPETADVIQFNTANNIALMSDPMDMTRRIWRKMNPNTNTFTQDSQDIITVITHGAEGEIYDTTNPGKLVRVPFVPRGAVASIGRNTSSGYQVGQGSTQSPVYELGYGHVAPTVEGGGARGRWGRIYTPQDSPWQLIAQAVENFLPVLTAPEKIVVSSTEMPA